MGRLFLGRVKTQFSNPTRALAAQHVFVSFFLAAGCQAAVDEDATEEDYFESRDQLNCDLLLECGLLMSEDECTMGSGLSECSEFDASAATACLAAMEDALDAAQADANACGDDPFSEECASVITWSDSAECGTTAGRPLFVDGEQVLPSVVRACPPGVSARAHAAEHWLQCARMESASGARIHPPGRRTRARGCADLDAGCGTGRRGRRG